MWLEVATSRIYLLASPILFLSILEKTYLIVALGVILATSVLAWRVIFQRKRRRRIAPATAHALLALGATLLSLLAAEAAAGVWLAWLHRARPCRRRSSPPTRRGTYPRSSTPSPAAR